MGFLDFLQGPDIHAGLEELARTPGGVLVDVRTPEEYREGRIPGSLNIPLQNLDKIRNHVDNEDVPLFVYCRSGVRSRQGVAELRRMGYSQVTNLGGIVSYRGKVER